MISKSKGKGIILAQQETESITNEVVDKSGSPKRDIIMIHNSSLMTESAMNITPKKKDTSKWKRAAREGQNMQRIRGIPSSLQRALAISNVGRKIAKGNSSSLSGKKLSGRIGKETKVCGHKAESVKNNLRFSDGFLVDCRGKSGSLMLMWRSELMGTILSYSAGHIDARFRQTIEDCDLYDLGSTGPKLTWNNRREGNGNVKERLDRFFADFCWRDRFSHAVVEHLSFNSSDHRAIILHFEKDVRSHNRCSQAFRFEPFWLKEKHLGSVVKKVWNESDEVRSSVFDLSLTKAPSPDGFQAIFFQKLWSVIGKDFSDVCLFILNDAAPIREFNFINVILIPKVHNPTSLNEFRPIALCNVVYKTVAKMLASRLKNLLQDLISPHQSAFIPGGQIFDNVMVVFESLHPISRKKSGRKGLMALKLDMSKGYDRVEWSFLRAVLTKMNFLSDWIGVVMDCVSSSNLSFVLNGRNVGSVTPSRGLRQGCPLSPYLFLFCAEAFSGLISDSEKNGRGLGLKCCHGAPTISHNENDLGSVLKKVWNESDEVRSSVFDLSLTKAPGPDGFQAIFFQKLWSVIGKDFSDVCLFILNDAAPIREFNFINVILIPKVHNPTSLNEFRPIALCNVVYKTVAKMLASRLKNLLQDLISPHQSAFIPGGQILDNVMVVFESLHSISQKKSGRKGLMALKLDMSKAYDRVEWSFLRAVLTKMNFPSDWIGVVMDCVSSSNLSFVLNGRNVGSVTLSRGLRQGCPLSPYLFLFCVEAFSGLISDSEKNGRGLGLKCCHGAPTISHLFFVNDSIMICKASMEHSLSIMKILETYERGSGQQINLHKSSISFSLNIDVLTRSGIQQQLGIEDCNCKDRYLELPSMMGRNKKRLFNDIKEKCGRRFGHGMEVSSCLEERRF
ncbi:hypothetical protein Dsin_030299 [Dipteronia sinensis]|uniref:Reverse transcriptase domain-containing protein n=1 Tax=Dipteronia sinensis TaxID=43782 RepID=A0AAD9ZJT3_9ROSI|nr:hypothetical protein Dsin_030299 [Dipteronia sinensis]